MKIEIKHEVKAILTLSIDEWCDITDSIAKSRNIADVIVFNVVKRVGRAYKNRTAFVPYITDTRRKAVIDTLCVVGVKGYFEISPYCNDKKPQKRYCAKYFTIDGTLSFVPTDIVVKED